MIYLLPLTKSSDLPSDLLIVIFIVTSYMGGVIVISMLCCDKNLVFESVVYFTSYKLTE